MYNLKDTKAKAKTSLHCYAKSTKANSAALFPIYVRLTVDGKRFEYCAKKFIQPSKWLNELSRVKGNSEEARSINNLLDFIKNRINDIQFELLKDNISLNIEEFENRILGTNATIILHLNLSRTFIKASINL